MSIQYASFSVGKHHNTSIRRSTRERMDEAGKLLDTVSKHEHAAARSAGEAYNVRFIGTDATATLFRGTERVDSRYAGIPSAEIRAARAKVAAIRDAASRPMVDARARVAKALRLADEVWRAT
jgi:hypothetical protein